MQKLLARDRREMRWKNDGGTTTEIATFPPGSALDDFAWRVSMARVDRAGPFSRFPGVDRSIALTSGQGMTLRMAGRGQVAIDATTAPLAFPGDVDVEATLTSGPIVDFNVMTRRGRFRHLLTRVSPSGSSRIAPLGTLALVVVVRGTLRLLGEAEPLALRDALVLDGGESMDVTYEPGAVTLVVNLWRC